MCQTDGAGGGIRTRGLLRERITYRDPIVCYDLKSAAFDRSWQLPHGNASGLLRFVRLAA
jgi:hypothetical protein